MDFLFLCFLMTFGGNFGDEQQSSSDAGKGKKPLNRRSAYQTQILEAFFKDCPHPTGSQRRQLCRDLGLDMKQIKTWFQNRRNQKKALADISDNSALRAKNKRIRDDNNAMVDTLKYVLCPACGGSSEREEAHRHYLQNLGLENARLSEEKAKISSFFAQHVSRPTSQADLSVPLPPSAMHFQPAAVQGLGNQLEGLSLNNPKASKNAVSAYRISKVIDPEKLRMSETAVSAMEELTSLLRVDEPLWVKSTNDGRCIIHRQTYERVFPKTTHSAISNVRIESSKASGLVGISPTNLVDMFLDSDKWADLFPTMVTQAKTLEVLDAGTIRNRNGALLLMYGEMQVLSPVVAPREFYFLRHCMMIEDGIWVIVDVSYSFLKERSNSFWKLPSGVMIEEMPNNMCSKVTWIEHVEVDSNSEMHRLYTDLICGNSPYGSYCWLSSLQRMSERLVFTTGEIAPSDFAEGVDWPEDRSGIVKLSERMIKRFFSLLNMPDKLVFPRVFNPNNSGMQFSIYNSTEPGDLCGKIVSATTSVWLPLPPESVFSFFLDIEKRHQWDLFSGSRPVAKIAHITTGTNPGNYISIIMPDSCEDFTVILQESFTDALGSYIIYAPVELPALSETVAGDDVSDLGLLPSGFFICGDGRPVAEGGAGSSSASAAGPGGSLLTVVFQILACSPSMELEMESLVKLSTLINYTVRKIKFALGCN